MTESLFDVVWDEPKARTTDPETSHAAAASLEHLTERRQAVWAILAEYGPLTDEALLAIYDQFAEDRIVPPQSPSGIRTRRNELTKLGLAIDTGQRGTTVSGRAAILWGAVDL
jgi:hypothetical protein